MSEPLANARAENVLASIRRFVSENDRRDRELGEQSDGEGGHSGLRSGPAFSSSGSDLLLLTPSFRVTDPDAWHAAGAAPEIDAKGRVPSGQDLSGSKPGGGKAAHETLVNASLRPAERHTVALPAAAADRKSILRLDDTVRLDEDVAGRRDGAGDRPSASTDSKILNQNPKSDPTSANRPAEFDTEHMADAARPRNRRAVRPPPDGALEAKIAALEAAIARTDGDWEPDGEGCDAYSGKTSGVMDWTQPERSVQKDAPYRLEPAARRDLPKVREAEAAGAVTSLTDLVDEDMLREVVADIVRQELRGAMGDRITRNVRKLVRREILLALESRELD